MDSNIPYVIPLSSQKPRTVSLVPTDPGSRYKMRQLQVQVVGKSKMIKTVLANILDVSKDMQVPPSFIGVFMGYEIGAQAKFDPKKPEKQQAFLSGEHDTKDLSKIMEKFINEVVLCPNCGLPEIILVADKKDVAGNCRACGASSPLDFTNEKFKRYIVNHPPSTSKGAFGGNQAAKKGEKEQKEKEAKEKEKEQRPKKVKTPVSPKSKSTDDNEEDADDEHGRAVVWYSDTSEEAARQRREAMLPESFLPMEDREVKKKSYMTEFSKLVESKDLEKIQQFKTENDIPDGTFIAILLEAMFNANSDMQAELRANNAVLAKFAPNAQQDLLNTIGDFCMKSPSSLSNICLILKELYDLEILDEETAISWYENGNLVPQLKQQVTPIIQWFREAEEESGSEEDD